MSAHTRTTSTLAAGVAAAVLILLASLWVRSRWTIDNAIVPLGQFIRLEAASGYGRVIFGGTRGDRDLGDRVTLTSRARLSYNDTAALLHRSRIIYYPYFDRGVAGFFTEYNRRMLLVTVPYWSLVLISACASAWTARRWWRVRTGRAF